ncbi:MAG: hypothetical protein WCY01_12705 [Alkalispirochaeta sp.]
MERFGHMFDGFQALKEIADNGGDLREWAERLADYLGEWDNLNEAWPMVQSEDGTQHGA